MRVRPLSAQGDFTIGVPWFDNVPQAVEQAIYTRLRLWLGEWYLDVTDGTPYLTDILGERAGKNPDAQIQRRILGTPGVTQIVTYSSQYTGNNRTLTVNATVQTQYSDTPLTINTALTVPAT